MRRDDVLRELRLAPVWRLRKPPAAPMDAGAESSPAPDAIRPVSRTTDAVAVSDETADVRRARIFALDYEALVADIAQCTACPLARTRNRTVAGVGDVRADWMFVGEAPGADEDAQGEPFVGVAGQLLDNMLAALGLARTTNVYIANVLKCRPPNNRAPEPLEAQACGAYLDRQIDLISPRVIVALGKSAACHLLRTEASVASLRNRIHRYRDTPLVVTYHPAYLLRNPVDKARAWEDLLFARRVLREQAGGAHVAS
jgi:uracil-DNA glycosylase